MAVVAADRGDLAPLFSNGAQAAGLANTLVTTESPNLGCIFHDFSQLAANVAQPANLANLSEGLATNHYFFGAINNSLQPGPTKALSNSVGASPTRSSPAPACSSRRPRPRPSPTAPRPPSIRSSPARPATPSSGPGCRAASQPGFVPADGGKVVPPSASGARSAGVAIPRPQPRGRTRPPPTPPSGRLRRAPGPWPRSGWAAGGLRLGLGRAPSLVAQRAVPGGTAVPVSGGAGPQDAGVGGVLLGSDRSQPGDGHPAGPEGDHTEGSAS